jgi:L-malate glycosyltransferase
VSGWPQSSLHLDSGREFRGGQRQVLYLLQGLSRRGHRVLLACPRDSALGERACAASIPVLPLTLRSGFDFPSAVRLARTVREQELDLVHAHDARSHAVARVAQGVCRTAALSDNLFVTRRSLGASTGRLDRLKYASPGTHYIAISTAVRDSLLRLGVRRESIVVVPSGIDVQRFAAVARLERDPWQLRQRGVWVVGTVGELSREKNHAMLLDALGRVRRQLPDAHLLLVGDGPKRSALEQRVRLLGLADAVTFAGRLDDVLPAYGAFDVFAFPSDTEGLGTALLDAMSAGVPVVATAAGGVLDIARHGESALVVPPRDPEAFAGALVRLRQQPDLASHLVRTAREVAARYDIDRMVDGTLAAYARLGSAGGRAARWEPESGTPHSGTHRDEPRRPGTRPPVTEGPRS